MSPNSQLTAPTTTARVSVWGSRHPLISLIASYPSHIHLIASYPSLDCLSICTRQFAECPSNETLSSIVSYLVLSTLSLGDIVNHARSQKYVELSVVQHGKGLILQKTYEAVKVCCKYFIIYPSTHHKAVLYKSSHFAFLKDLLGDHVEIIP